MPQIYRAYYHPNTSNIWLDRAKDSMHITTLHSDSLTPYSTRSGSDTPQPRNQYLQMVERVKPYVKPRAEMKGISWYGWWSSSQEQQVWHRKQAMPQTTESCVCKPTFSSWVVTSQNGCREILRWGEVVKSCMDSLCAGIITARVGWALRVQKSQRKQERKETPES